MRLLLILLYSGIYLYAENIVYTNNTIHAFIPEADTLQFTAGFEQVNDTIDILNIKESEFKSNTENFDSLGDMQGINLNFGYTLNDKWYMNLKYNLKDLQYSDTTLTNQNFDIYLRYQIYQDENSAFAIDGGYTMNIANDTYINNLKTINDGLNDIASDKEITISQIDNKHTLVYKGDDGSTKTVNLKNKPYLALVDTDDKSLYARVIFSLKKARWLFDAYGGYSKTSIKNKTDSSILYEDDSDLQQELGDITFNQKRTDNMLFGGLGAGYQWDKWYGEVNYQYNHLFRISCLSETTMNHIFNININYSLNDNLKFYLGGKLMLNQFNGEIPYLYGEYTDTSFDHKYGFINAGIIYTF